METNRIIIYPKDVQRITGKSDRWCRMVLAQVKQKLNKEKNQLVTIQEFCQHMGINEKVVEDYLAGS